MLFPVMAYKFTFGLFLLWILISGCATERTIGPAISENGSNEESRVKAREKVVQNKNAEQSNESEASSFKLESKTKTEDDDGTFKIVASEEINGEDSDHLKQSSDSEQDTDTELVNDQREKQVQKKPVEIKEIKKKKEIELDETNSQLTGGHSTKENQSEISELKTISDKQSSKDSSILIENEKERSRFSLGHGSKLDPNGANLTEKGGEPEPVLRSSDQVSSDSRIELGTSVIQEENESTRSSVELGEFFDSPVVRNSEKLKPKIIFTDEQKVSDPTRLLRNDRLGFVETFPKEKENTSKNELNLKKVEFGIPNKSNDHEDSSVRLKSLLGQDTVKNDDNSLRQINLKDLDADSRNNTLNQEPGQKVALKNNMEEGSNNYSLELDKKPEVSLSESRNYGAIKKFVGGERLPLDRNSSTAKGSRNFGKIREWSSQSRERNSTSSLEEKNAKQYDRAKEWIRKKGRVQ